MASPPTPNSFALGDVISWGPAIEHGQRLRAGRILELVTARLEAPEDETADRLFALTNTHRYVLVERIAKSRHSTVCVAVDRLLTRDVVIKIHTTASGEIDERVLFEARTMSRIDHPNVVRIFDLGISDGRCYSVIEPCDTDMHVWSATRGWREILERILEAGHGLARLHAEGLIHGDIKPANILIKDGVAKVADFGLAAEPGRAESIAGTPGYIAPEIAVGIRSASGDVFALAATAWACLFGVPPFGSPPLTGDAGAAIGLLVHRAIEGEFAPDLRRQPGLPKLVRVVLRNGLEPEPAKQPPLDVWLAELTAVLETGDFVKKLRQRAPTVTLATAVVLMFGVLMSGDGARRNNEPVPMRTEVLDRAAQIDDVEHIAAHGNPDDALSALHHAYSQADELEASELARFGDAAELVAQRFEDLGRYEDAVIAWSFAERLFQRAGQAERVRGAERSLRIAIDQFDRTKEAPFGNR